MAEDLQDGILGPAGELSVKLPVFEGPLDLLLFLLRKNEIDIYDIPIEKITSQYLSVLRAMENLSLDIAGEFFVMASTLMYIKSRMLLPADERLAQKDEEREEGEDPRWELVEQLLEYKKFKQGAMDLEDMINARQNCLGRNFLPGAEAPAPRPLKKSDKIELWNAFNNVLRRLAEKLVQGEITGEQVSVADRMEYILDLDCDEFCFSKLFEKGKTTIPMLVATFLAVLELARLRRLDISQGGLFGEIYLKKLSAPAAEENNANSENSPETNLEGGAGGAPSEPFGGTSESSVSPEPSESGASA